MVCALHVSVSVSVCACKCTCMRACRAGIGRGPVDSGGYHRSNYFIIVRYGSF